VPCLTIIFLAMTQDIRQTDDIHFAPALTPKKKPQQNSAEAFYFGAEGQSWDRLMLKSQILAKQTEADNLKTIKPLTVQSLSLTLIRVQ